jgi:eukaryotic-like serine/threonine-protein kinase
MRVAGLTQEEEEEGMVGPGDVLAGKYRIERVLGRGGMGVVVAAVHLRLDEKVAIKFLLPEAIGNADAMGRFDREARAAVKIRSEHVARVIDVSTLENGAPYIVMEHLEGNDLAQTVRKRGALPVGEAVGYMLQVCEVLAEAHALGIVHRDLKPANLFLITRPDGTTCVKVLDFGISKIMSGGGASSEPQAALTATDTVLGSPIYMSPEQMTTPKEVDPRADLWSFGATLFMLLTGKPPFDGDSIAQVCGMILMAKPPSLLDLRPDAPPGLAQVITRCLQRDREARWANAGELAAALMEFAPAEARLAGERAMKVVAVTSGMSMPVVEVPRTEITGSGAVAATTGSGASTTDKSLPKTIATWSNSQDRSQDLPAMLRPRPRWPLIAGGVAAVLAVGVGLGMLTGGRHETAASEGATAAASASAAPPPPPAPAPVASASAPVVTPSASVAADPKSTGKAHTAKASAPPPPPPPPSAKKKSGDLFDDRL